MITQQQKRTDAVNVGGTLGGAYQHTEYAAALRNAVVGHAAGESIEAEFPELAAVAVLGYN